MVVSFKKNMLYFLAAKTLTKRWITQGIISFWQTFFLPDLYFFSNHFRDSFTGGGDVTPFLAREGNKGGREESIESVNYRDAYKCHVLYCHSIKRGLTVYQINIFLSAYLGKHCVHVEINLIKVWFGNKVDDMKLMRGVFLFITYGTLWKKS